MRKSTVSILERPGLRRRPRPPASWVCGPIGRARGSTGTSGPGCATPPSIRPEPSGDDIVTWGEFVELGYLREYRRKGVPLQRLRPVIDELRREFETPYPLATAKPYVYGKELVLDVQEKTRPPASRSRS